MNNPISNENAQPSCESRAPQLSAMMDGELASSDLADLQLHLDDCLNCQNQLRMFTQVNSFVDSLSIPPAVNGHRSFDENTFASLSEPTKSNPGPPVKPVRINKPVHVNHWKLIRRIIPIAAAAILLISLAINAIPSPNPTEDTDISSAQIVQPMKDLHLINFQIQRRQDVLLQTFEMDLRSLKLDAGQLDLNPEDLQTLQSQIDALIEEVNLIETGPPPVLTPFPLESIMKLSMSVLIAFTLIGANPFNLNGQESPSREIKIKQEQMEKVLEANGKKLEAWAEKNAKDWESWAERFEYKMEKWAEVQEQEMEQWGESFGNRWEKWAEKMESGDFDQDEMKAMLEENLQMIKELPIKDLLDGGLKEGLGELKNAPFDSLGELHDLIGGSLELSLQSMEKVEKELKGKLSKELKEKLSKELKGKVYKALKQDKLKELKLLRINDLKLKELDELKVRMSALQTKELHAALGMLQNSLDASKTELDKNAAEKILHLEKLMKNKMGMDADKQAKILAVLNRELAVAKSLKDKSKSKDGKAEFLKAILLQKALGKTSEVEAKKMFMEARMLEAKRAMASQSRKKLELNSAREAMEASRAAMRASKESLERHYQDLKAQNADLDVKNNEIERMRDEIKMLRKEVEAMKRKKKDKN